MAYNSGRMKTRKMKLFLTTILFATTISVFGQTTFNYQTDFKNILAKTKDKNDSLSYEKLLPRFSANDTTLTDYEVLALLIGFTDKPDYKPYDDISTEREIYDLNDKNKYKEGLELGQKFLKTHPLSVKTLYEIAYSFHKLNQEDKTKYYVYQGQKIWKAMYFSGKGFTPETPTFALGPADGQDYIKKFLGAGIGTMGSGRDKNNNFLDILEAKLEEKSITLYFIIQHATNKMFGGKSFEEEMKEQDKKKKKTDNE